MKSLTKLALTLALVAGMSAAAHAQIAAWDFTGEDNVATSAAEIFAGLDSSNLLTRGAGAASSAGVNSFRTTGFSSNGISTANTDYFQFTLSATTGLQSSLASIDIRTTGTATYVASPGVSQQFAFSLDGTNFTLIGSPTITIGTNQTASIDLSAVPALQGVADSQTVTFRYYANGQTKTGGYGFFSNALGNNGSLTAHWKPFPSLRFTCSSGSACSSAVSVSCAVNTPNGSSIFAKTRAARRGFFVGLTDA